jgi:hypothetical protein
MMTSPPGSQGGERPPEGSYSPLTNQDASDDLADTDVTRRPLRAGEPVLLTWDAAAQVARVLFEADRLGTLVTQITDETPGELYRAIRAHAVAADRAAHGVPGEVLSTDSRRSSVW